ncbi:MAG: glycosyltransferase [Bdellovibrionales bacterium]|nr:glycosyltransferase [Bdellovibrionales bacterium]
MKIVILGPKNSIHLCRWANSLYDFGHEVYVISCHKGIGELNPNIKGYDLLFNPPLGYFFNYIQLKKLIKKISPDILHVHYASGYGLLGAFSKFSPQFLSVWGSDVNSFPYKNLFNKMIIIHNLKCADFICATSKSLAESVIKLNKDFANKIEIIPFGIDIHKFKKIKRKKIDQMFTIGTVKSLEKIYGIDILIDGFNEFLKKINRMQNKKSTFKLKIIGSGSLNNSLKKKCKKLKLESEIEFIEKVNHRQVPGMLNSIDIYVAMSREESFGVSVLEASACEIPVIVSEVGGLPEVVVNNKTGFIIKNEDAKSLADKIYHLYCSSKLRIEMGANGRSFVKSNYKWEDSVKKLHTLYYKAVR